MNAKFSGSSIRSKIACGLAMLSGIGLGSLMLQEQALSQSSGERRDINVQLYCTETINHRQLEAYPSSIYRVTVRSTVDNTQTTIRPAYRWKCITDIISRRNGSLFRRFWRGVDMNDACIRQYGTGYRAGLGSLNNPYSWYCTRR